MYSVFEFPFYALSCNIPDGHVSRRSGSKSRRHGTHAAQMHASTHLIPNRCAGGRIGCRQIADIVVLQQHLVVATVRIDQLLAVGNGRRAGAARRHDCDPNVCDATESGIYSRRVNKSAPWARAREMHRTARAYVCGTDSPKRTVITPTTKMRARALK